MDFTLAQLGQTISNDKDNDQQDVSHLAFFPKGRSVNRLFKFRTFLFDRCLTVFFSKKRKKVNLLTRRRHISAAYLTS